MGWTWSAESGRSVANSPFVLLTPIRLDGDHVEGVSGRESQRPSKLHCELARFAELDAIVPRRLVRRELGEDTALIASVPTASSGSRIEWPRNLLMPLEDVELPRPRLSNWDRVDLTLSAGDGGREHTSRRTASGEENVLAVAAPDTRAGG